MGAINALAQNSWYGTSSWAEHSSMELTTGHARPGRIQFNSLSSGAAITSLSFRFNKTNSGGGGTFKFYVTDNESLSPKQLSSMTYLGEMPAFGSGTGWKTLAVPSSMLEAFSQFTGVWYLVLTCSVYVTFYGEYPYNDTNDPRFVGEYADGSLYVSSGGVMRLAPPYVSDGGVMRFGTALVSVGGVMKQGIP